MSNDKVMFSAKVSRARYAELGAEATRRSITRSELLDEILEDRYPNANVDATSS